MAGMIEHQGIVQAVADGRATVAVETSGCKSCGHGGSCGIGKVAGGRPATLLVLPAPAGLKAGDPVLLQLPEARVNATALLGYLFPAVALLVGAGIGAATAGTDAGTALGAMAGFALALALSRLAVSLLPGLAAVPRLLPLSPLSQQESSHER